MLEALRTAAHSFIAKILFGLLILSFAVWGIGDVVRGGLATAPAIVVGKIDISAEEVQSQYRREVTRLQRMFGPQFTEEQARQMGMLDSTIEQMAARALLDQAAMDLDMVASDEAVMQALSANPAFRNELGQFDRYRLRQAINQAGYGEEQFIAMARRDLMRSQLIATVSAGMTPPKVLVDSLFAHRGEKRVAEQRSFAAEQMPAPETPDEATLKAYHESHSQAFMAPEYRAFTALVLRPADVAELVAISDKDLEDAYAQRAHEFVVPETRALRQIVVADQDKAQAAAALAKDGKDLDAIAKELGAAVTDLGVMDRQTVAGLSADLADAAFAPPQPGITAPVQTPFGWHLVAVGDITPGKERPLAEVREQLRDEVLRERAIDRLYELANKIEDLLAGGKSLDEAGQAFNLKPLKVAAADVDGKGPDGKPADGMPASLAFRKTLFDTAEGSESRTTELEDNQGFFVVHVDTVTPPAVKPFELVKDEVLKAWTAEQRLAEARRRAEQALATLKDGKPVAGIEARTSEPFTRAPAAASGVAAPVAAAAFTLQPGESELVTTPDGAVVVTLNKVIPADAAADPAAVDRIRQQLAQQMAGDLVDEMVAALRERYGVKVNRSVIEGRMR